MPHKAFKGKVIKETKNFLKIKLETGGVHTIIKQKGLKKRDICFIFFDYKTLSIKNVMTPYEIANIAEEPTIYDIDNPRIGDFS